MATILLKTSIKAPLNQCFDLARSIDLHQDTFAHTNEKAIAGKKHGLLGLGEQVTWEAIHFGCKYQLTSEITTCQAPYRFVDQMKKGPFAYLYHEHIFKENHEGVDMIDYFEFRSPYGLLGRFVDAVFMKRYLRKLLCLRNKKIKATAESSVKAQ